MKLSLNYEVTARQEGWNNRVVLDVAITTGDKTVPAWTGISVEGFLEILTDVAHESIIDIIAASSFSKVLKPTRTDD